MAELSAIAINGSDLPIQPSLLIEWREYQQKDHMAIDGSMQRDRIRTAQNTVGYKYNVRMTFRQVTSANWQALDALFVSGSGIAYNNPQSGKFGTLTFSGLPTVEDATQYSPGSSLLADYIVTIREF